MPAVLQLIDTLDAGGAERVAVNLANALALRGWESHLCATRRGGPLQTEIASTVQIHLLRRKNRYDVAAILRLVRYIRAERVQIVHAHSSSLFLGAIAARLAGCKLVWHDHFGKGDTDHRSPFMYQVFATRIDAAFAVTQALASESNKRFHIPGQKVVYLPNFLLSNNTPVSPVEIPGHRGGRLICVANIRLQKDQLGLLQAFRTVRAQRPDAHLLLAGAPVEPEYARQVQDAIAAMELSSSVTLLGRRGDVSAVLTGCDIAVLPSRSEGFPLTLLEYGQAGLPVVATRVGQCAEILDEGNAGLLVPPLNPDQLAAAVLRLLDDPHLARSLGERLRRRTQTVYSQDTILCQVETIYHAVLQGTTIA